MITMTPGGLQISLKGQPKFALSETIYEIMTGTLVLESSLARSCHPTSLIHRVVLLGPLPVSSTPNLQKPFMKVLTLECVELQRLRPTYLEIQISTFSKLNLKISNYINLS